MTFVDKILIMCSLIQLKTNSQPNKQNNSTFRTVLEKIYGHSNLILIYFHKQEKHNEKITLRFAIYFAYYRNGMNEWRRRLLNGTRTMCFHLNGMFFGLDLIIDTPYHVDSWNETESEQQTYWTVVPERISLYAVPCRAPRHAASRAPHKTT